MILSRFFSRASFLIALAPLSRAGVLTVGPDGSGAQFTEIQAAIDAALDDDVILVRPGTYAPILVHKPLRILGDGTGSVVIDGVRDSGVAVLALGAGQEFVLSGVTVRAFPFLFFQSAIFLSNNQGTVVLHDVLVDQTPTVGLEAENCARVLVLDCRILDAGVPGDSFNERGAVLVRDSELVLSGGEVRAGGGNVFQSLAANAIEISRSRLHVWGARVRGGSLSPGPQGNALQGGTAIRAGSRSTVNLFGGPGSEVVGGDGGLDGSSANLPGGPALALANRSSALIHSGLALHGGLDGLGQLKAAGVALDAASTAAFDPEVFPTLSSNVAQAQLGSSFALTLAGNPGGYQVLFLSLRTGPTLTLPHVGGLGYLDGTNLLKVTSEVLPASAAYTFQCRVPPLAALLGSTLFFQSSELLAGQFAIGNPALVTLH